MSEIENILNTNFIQTKPLELNQQQFPNRLKYGTLFETQLGYYLTKKYNNLLHVSEYSPNVLYKTIDDVKFKLTDFIGSNLYNSEQIHFIELKLKKGTVVNKKRYANLPKDQVNRYIQYAKLNNAELDLYFGFSTEKQILKLTMADLMKPSIVTSYPVWENGKKTDKEELVCLYDYKNPDYESIEVDLDWDLFKQKSY